MRRICMTLGLAGLFGSVLCSGVSRAGCNTGEAGCPAPAAKKCQTPPWCAERFARWDACREKVTDPIHKFFNPPCVKRLAERAAARSEKCASE